ncbi:hypothetical protein HK405_005178, partial [Cladochytrium tenue]
MTVSLTVIMFELTGTLDYILPCMITLMVAKLVGDAFGQGGASDTLIREMAFPFLDYASDELIGRPAYEIMTPREDLVLLDAATSTLADLDRVLSSSIRPVRGYPVLTSSATATFAGYAHRAVVAAAARRARTAGLPPSTRVAFDPGPRAAAIAVVPPPPSGPHAVVPIDRALFSVHPNAEIELVIDMFKKLGPRMLVVLDHGRLAGVITKKDLLRSLQDRTARFEPQLVTRSPFDFEAS